MKLSFSAKLNRSSFSVTIPETRYICGLAAVVGWTLPVDLDDLGGTRRFDPVLTLIRFRDAEGFHFFNVRPRKRVSAGVAFRRVWTVATGFVG